MRRPFFYGVLSLAATLRVVVPTFKMAPGYFLFRPCFGCSGYTSGLNPLPPVFHPGQVARCPFKGYIHAIHLA